MNPEQKALADHSFDCVRIADLLYEVASETPDQGRANQLRSHANQFRQRSVELRKQCTSMADTQPWEKQGPG
jgi:hypothetical protein